LADKDFGRAPRAGVGALLERTDDLSLLGEALAEVRRSSQGRLVLLAGEAGVGKTALLRRFCAEQPPSAGIMWGACDPLLTPRPLGPLLDIAEGTGGELEELLAGGAKPHEVVGALMRALAERTGTIVVLEDMHWADEATLDALRLLGRRIDAVPALIVASYRDDELDRVHPLRIAIGELGGGPAISRLRVEPLSSAAVAELAEPHELDAEALYRVSGGNPFFVTEVLAAGVPALPQTVRDAVLARGARLSERGRRLLEAVAVVPQPVELWLLEALAQDSVDRVEECLASGMLTSGPAAVGFRHELARVAVEDSLPADRRAALHRLALAALLDPPAGGQDLARLAHHADAADDGKSVLRFAPAAGERAASLGAHREAAAQYARALRFADQAPVQERARLLDLCAGEYTLDRPLQKCDRAATTGDRMSRRARRHSQAGRVARRAVMALVDGRSHRGGARRRG
jgi:predicted ATPase